MIDNVRNTIYGYTVAESMSFISAELDQDANGLWVIVSRGASGFVLTGPALVEYVRKAIRAHLDAGAVPVRGGVGTEYEWLHQPQYGTDREEITEAIIAEWLALPDQSSSGLCGDAPWFARPDPKSPKYVKIE